MLESGPHALHVKWRKILGAKTCPSLSSFNFPSNYWTAQLYFKHPTNGSYKRVPVVPVQPLLGGSNGASGGLTVYYTQFDLSKDNLKQQKITAFQPVGPLTTTDISRSSDNPGLPYDCGNPDRNQ